MSDNGCYEIIFQIGQLPEMLYEVSKGHLFGMIALMASYQRVIPYNVDLSYQTDYKEWYDWPASTFMLTWRSSMSDVYFKRESHLEMIKRYNIDVKKYTDRFIFHIDHLHLYFFIDRKKMEEDGVIIDEWIAGAELIAELMDGRFEVDTPSRRRAIEMNNRLMDSIPELIL